MTEQPGEQGEDPTDSFTSTASSPSPDPTPTAASAAAIVADDEIEGSTTDPRRWLATKTRRRIALALVVILGCWAGGWFRASSDDGLTAAQADQATVRLTLDGFPLGQANGCDDLGGPQAALQIPLHNYSPGPVVIRSISVDPPGQPSGAAQKLGFTIPPGGSTTVEALIPIQLCTAHQSSKCPSTEVELDATAAVVPESGHVHEIRLPIGEWVPTKFLQLYEDAPLADWSSSLTCQ